MICTYNYSPAVNNCSMFTLWLGVFCHKTWDWRQYLETIPTREFDSDCHQSSTEMFLAIPLAKSDPVYI